MDNTRFSKFTQEFILKWECDWPSDKSGQYSNDPDDPGGPTKFGIDLTATAQMYPKEGWNAAKIKALTIDQALRIYKDKYWDAHGLDSISSPMAECRYNSWVNGGKPTLWSQQCEGDARKYISLMEQYYRNLASARPKLEKYLKGWLNRSEDLRKYLNL